MKPEKLFREEFESMCGKDCTTFIGESIKKDLKEIDLESNKYFYLLMEQKMDDPDWKEHGDCDPDAGKSWTYEVPVYQISGERFDMDSFEGLHHFNKKDLTCLYVYDDDGEDYDLELTEDQKTIIEYLDQGAKDILEYKGTGDPYKDYAGYSTFMPPTRRR